MLVWLREYYIVVVLFVLVGYAMGAVVCRFAIDQECGSDVVGRVEREVEKYLDTKVKERGGFTRKFVSPGHVGVADRICSSPKGFMWLKENHMIIVFFVLIGFVMGAVVCRLAID